MDAKSTILQIPLGRGWEHPADEAYYQAQRDAAIKWMREAGIEVLSDPPKETDHANAQDRIHRNS